MAVLALLLLASLYSWTVILGKISTFGKATKESRHFIRAFRKATRLQEIASLAADCKLSPLARSLRMCTRPTSARPAVRDRRATSLLWSARRRPQPARPSPDWSAA